MVDRVHTIQKLGGSGVITQINSVADADCVEKISAEAGKVVASAETNPAPNGGCDFLFGTLYGYSEHLDQSNTRWATHTGSQFGSLEATEAERAMKTKEKEKEEKKKTDDISDESYDVLEESVACDAALADLDQNINLIWQNLPTGSMLILLTGVGNTPYVKTLQERKWKRAQGLGPWGKWTEEAEAELRKEADRARRGMVWAGVKGEECVEKEQET